jgi:hypothetical protein
VLRDDWPVVVPDPAGARHAGSRRVSSINPRQGCPGGGRSRPGRNTVRSVYPLAPELNRQVISLTGLRSARDAIYASMKVILLLVLALSATAASAQTALPAWHRSRWRSRAATIVD